MNMNGMLKLIYWKVMRMKQLKKLEKQEIIFLIGVLEDLVENELVVEEEQKEFELLNSIYRKLTKSLSDLYGNDLGRYFYYEHKEQKTEMGKDYIRNIIVEEDEEIIKTNIFTDYGNFHYEQKEIIKNKKSGEISERITTKFVE